MNPPGLGTTAIHAQVIVHRYAGYTGGAPDASWAMPSLCKSMLRSPRELPGMLPVVDLSTIILHASFGRRIPCKLFECDMDC